MDTDEFAAKELKARKGFSLSASIPFSDLNFQPSTISFGDQSDVSNSSSLDLADRP